MTYLEDVARAGADFEALLTSTAELLEQTTVNEGGDRVKTWAPTDPPTTWPARIAPVGGGEGGESGSQADDRTTHVLSVPAGADVPNTGRLTIEGGTYEVLLVRTRTDEVLRRVEVRSL